MIEEQAVLQAQDIILGLLKRHRVKKKELATRMGCTPSFVTKLLHGPGMSIKHFAKACFHLGYDVKLCVTRTKNGNHCSTLR